MCTAVVYIERRIMIIGPGPHPNQGSYDMAELDWYRLYNLS
jgi:hypothetical protein